VTELASTLDACIPNASTNALVTLASIAEFALVSV